MGHLWAKGWVIYFLSQQFGIRSMRLMTTFFAAACLAALSVSHADTLLLDDLDASRGSADFRPARGMSMDRVEAQFGSPINRVAAIGEPPITRWEYADFTVYFEYQLVIHSVAKR